MRSKLLQKRGATAPAVDKVAEYQKAAVAIYPGDAEGQANLVESLLEEDENPDGGTPLEVWKAEWRAEFEAECAEIEKRLGIKNGDLPKK